MPDFLFNGQAHGDVASRLLACNMDLGVMRPFVGNDGATYVTMATGESDAEGQPVFRNQLVSNAPTTLRQDDWKLIDDRVTRVAQNRLRAFNDLRAAGLTRNVPNAMSKTVMEFHNMSDITGATISMDGLRRSEGDRPVFDLSTIPLPIIHKDFQFSLREVMISRNGQSALDTTTAELAARKVAEEVEALTLGTTTFSYGGGSIFGYTNYTHRMTKSLTAPTGSNNDVVINEVIAMREQAYAKSQYGPFMVYVSPAWDAYLDRDYSATKGEGTLRQRILQIEGISGIRTIDRLTGTTMILVQMTSDTVEAVVGVDIATVQWESHGGFMLHFKVLAILLPLLKADQNGNSGIVHGKVP